MDTLFAISDDELDQLEAEVNTFKVVPRPRDTITELREYHGWTLNKLEVLENYFVLYRRVAGGGTYIDAFAGTGRGTSIRNGEQRVRDGSALIAAKSGAFSQLHLCEKDSDSIDQLDGSVATLTERQIDRINIHNGDCNRIIPGLIDSERLDSERPCFALLDQDSTQLTWETIEKLAHWKAYEPPPEGQGRPKRCKVELWILFNSHQVVNRIWPSDREKHPMPLGVDALDRMFGQRSVWFDLWEAGASTDALVERYKERLYDLGYQYVIPQLIKDPATGRPQYFMYHATDHPSAISLMRWAKRNADGYENVQLPGFEI
ncbi:three-Cys-motif partner protein TcmP [Candidatus Poriferisodalis sp.]|uniref:three-Cys-motif partner protein TcmP n=1 Tax=Candidatus Poriferisodalis sp. TaxID=3101277 RepID=UPI003D0CCA96